MLRDASVAEEIRYSGYFLNTLEKYPDFWCDYMVYGQDEFPANLVPPTAKRFVRGRE